MAESKTNASDHGIYIIDRVSQVSQSIIHHTFDFSKSNVCFSLGNNRLNKSLISCLNIYFRLNKNNENEIYGRLRFTRLTRRERIELRNQTEVKNKQNNIFFFAEKKN